jgi:hypothetical protein
MNESFFPLFFKKEVLALFAGDSARKRFFFEKKKQKTFVTSS